MAGIMAGGAFSSGSKGAHLFVIFDRLILPTGVADQFMTTGAAHTLEHHLTRNDFVTRVVALKAFKGSVFPHPDGLEGLVLKRQAMF
jgi:hypothetical protein